MTKTYIIAGATWTAEVTVEGDQPENELQVEACTRAVERHFNKRSDITYNSHPPIRLTESQKAKDQIHATLVELLTEELVPNCGIGMMLCIMDNTVPDEGKKEPYEWFINSKSILQNVGCPSLVHAFNEKYPDTKNQKQS